MSTHENAAPLDGWQMPTRELRRHCGIDQATTHCGTCGNQIPATPVAAVFAPVDDWPYSLMSGVGEN